MKQTLKYISLSLCIIALLSSCVDDFITEYETQKDEYTVYYNVTYSTINDFHNIAYVSFTDFFDSNHKYTGKPSQTVRSIEGTEEYIRMERVPKGSHIELSTYVDVAEALPNTKVEISIEISKKGGSTPFTEVAKTKANCPLKGEPLTISYDIPN